ncbi:CAP domain-containing protein [Streptomyces sp. NPDC048297]|uniref:CAP domain-containing protein n=1 Tax=Streptomyces sp. NPDC048297 TaxID=3365531 RepID=UPI003716050E
MGRHRRSAAGRAAEARATEVRDTEVTHTHRPGTDGDDPNSSANGHETTSLAPYLAPEAYAETNARSTAYLFATDDPTVPSGDAPHERRQSKKIPKPVRTGLLGVTAAVALGAAAVGAGVVPGMQNYRLGGGTSNGVRTQAAETSANKATQQGGTSGTVALPSAGGSAKSDSVKDIPAKGSSTEAGPAPSGSAKTDPTKGGSTKGGPTKNSRAKDVPAKNGSTKNGSTQRSAPPSPSASAAPSKSTVPSQSGAPSKSAAPSKSPSASLSKSASHAKSASTATATAPAPTRTPRTRSVPKPTPAGPKARAAVPKATPAAPKATLSVPKSTPSRTAPKSTPSHTVPKSTPSHTAPKSAPSRPAPKSTPSPAPSRTVPKAPVVTPPAVTVSARVVAEAEVLKLVNEERAKVGCSALAANSSLTGLAETFSADMAARSFFSDTDPDGATPWDRAAKAGMTDLGAENIARGQADAAAVMDAWMKSPGHRANILNCDFKTLGVGVHFGPGGPWWTQDFGY